MSDQYWQCYQLRTQQHSLFLSLGIKILLSYKQHAGLENHTCTQIIRLKTSGYSVVFS